MANKLGVIAIIGLTVSVVSLSSAAVIGHYQSDSNFDLGDLDWDGKPRCRFDETEKAATRQMPWSGDGEAIINLPATVHYRPGSGERLEVSGNPQLLTHLRVRNGRVELDCNLRGENDQLAIILPGREFREFTVNSGAHPTLEQINQRDLDLNLRGSGRVTASGTLEALNLSVSGSGQARLAALFVKRLDFSMSGSARAEATAEESADVSISGSGHARLSTGKNFQGLDISISGSGNIEGSGNAQRLDLSISGSGEARLAELVVQQADVSISGSGDVDIAPQDRAEIHISGSGDVRLHAEPKSLNSVIKGSGSVTRRSVP